MTEVWSAQTEDLDLLVAWAAGAETVLDVATGGGDAARRLREAGLQVVTCDPAPGTQPDVVCPAEDLPFADRSFDVVACRSAAHHFVDVPVALAEMARVADTAVLLVDTLNMGSAVEEAEVLRDPSHVRNYTRAEWETFFGDAGLIVDDLQLVRTSVDFGDWLARTGCTGDDASLAETLLGDRVADGRITLDKIALLGVTA